MQSTPPSMVVQTTTLINGFPKALYDFILPDPPTGWTGAVTAGNKYAFDAAPAGAGTATGTNGAAGNLRVYHV